MNIAEGSIEECRYYLILVHDLGYGQTEKLMKLLEEASRLLTADANAILTSDSWQGRRPCLVSTEDYPFSLVFLAPVVLRRFFQYPGRRLAWAMATTKEFFPSVR